ncbi:hypothetical protein LTR10_006445 [Elasticomyces elasticus]|nr:hypothetical protein LTR10_006445 [Elasticomyces elasticus]KAK4973159.1 hypothetical protein LTR42_006453 [Elasticomyces elasticus]
MESFNSFSFHSDTKEISRKQLEERYETHDGSSETHQYTGPLSSAPYEMRRSVAQEPRPRPYYGEYQLFPSEDFDDFFGPSDQGSGEYQLSPPAQYGSNNQPRDQHWHRHDSATSRSPKHHASSQATQNDFLMDSGMNELMPDQYVLGEDGFLQYNEMYYDTVAISDGRISSSDLGQPQMLVGYTPPAPPAPVNAPVAVLAQANAPSAPAPVVAPGVLFGIPLNLMVANANPPHPRNNPVVPTAVTIYTLGPALPTFVNVLGIRRLAGHGVDLEAGVNVPAKEAQMPHCWVSIAELLMAILRAGCCQLKLTRQPRIKTAGFA